MEKINEIPASPLDIFLLPVWVHKKLSIRMRGLIPAFLFVGFFDMVFSQNIVKAGYFKGETRVILLRLLAFTVLSLIIGAIDIICTAVPIAEFAVMIGRRSQKYVSNRISVILMKSYAVSHILFIIPTFLFVYSGIDWMNVNASSSSQVRLFSSFIIILMSFLPYFQLGVFYRTLSIRTRIQAFGKLILILAAFFWMQICSGVILFIEDTFHGFLLKLL